jgi:hypothetical protein
LKDLRLRRILKVKRYELLLLVAVASCSCYSVAQLAEREPVAVVEVGGAASRSFTESQSSFGPTLGLEFTPVENRLELEIGVTPLFRRHATEWSVDLLFKKPWTISDRVEFMLGIGPEWIHSNEAGIKANSGAIEAAPDFMFWSTKRHRFGWYLEPSYEYKLGSGHEHSVGVSGGVLIGIP